MKYLLSLLLLLVPLGCTIDERADDFRGYIVDNTYSLFIHKEADADMIVREWPVALEQAIQYLLRYEGVNEDALRLRSTIYRYYILPGPFQTGDSPTGWAAGVAYIELNTIAVSWQVGESTHAPALGHELGHMILGSEFEHGWTPPLK